MWTEKLASVSRKSSLGFLWEKVFLAAAQYFKNRKNHIIKIKDVVNQ